MGTLFCRAGTVRYHQSAHRARRTDEIGHADVPRQKTRRAHHAQSRIDAWGRSRDPAILWIDLPLGFVGATREPVTGRGESATGVTVSSTVRRSPPSSSFPDSRRRRPSGIRSLRTRYSPAFVAAILALAAASKPPAIATEAALKSRISRGSRWPGT